MNFIALMQIVGYNKNSMAAESWQKKDDALDILHLPPRDVWLYDPEVNGRLPTPVDEYGFVDADALIAIGKSTIAPEFDWSLGETSDFHHMYWASSRYPNLPKETVNPARFRKLPINQIIISRLFHSWSHKLFAEPEVPSKEAMASLIETYDTEKKLFRTAKQSVKLTRARYMPEDKLLRGFEHHLWEFLLTIEAAQEKSSTFHTIDLNEFDPSTPEELHALAKFLGRAVKTANRARDVRSALIPPTPYTEAGATLVL